VRGAALHRMVQGATRDHRGRDGHRLRNIVLRGARHAVVVRPAVDRRQGCAPVPMRRRRVRLPLQGVRVPWVRLRLEPAEQAADEVVGEDELREDEPECSEREEHVQTRQPAEVIVNLRRLVTTLLERTPYEVYRETT